MAMFLARAGALVYVLWGLLHVVAAYRVYRLGAGLEPGMIQGRIWQDAWNLLFFAVFAIVVAFAMNWRNSRSGFWLNLVVVSAADIGFVAFVLLPGHVPLVPGVIGPLLWIAAVILTGSARLAVRRPEGR